MLFSFQRVGIDIFLHVGVGVLYHLEDALFIGPLDEILRQPGILLAGTSHNDDTEIMLFAPGPGPGRAVGDADAAADALLCIPDHFAVDQREGADRPDIAVFDTLFTANAAVGIILGFRHADEAEVVHPDLAAVIGTAGKGNLDMQMVGEDHLVHLSGQGGGIVAAEGAQTLARTGYHVPGTGSRISLVPLFLVDAGIIDNGLDRLIDSVHILQFDAGQLNALAVGHKDRPVAVLLRHLGDLRHAFGVDHAAGNTDPAGSLTPDFGVTERIFL